MDFVTFPIRIGASGWISRTDGPVESIVHLLGVLADTQQGSWRGSAIFGVRERLLELHQKHSARLIAIKQINETLSDLGIDWVRVEAIDREPSGEYGTSVFIFTLSYPGKGVEVERLEIRTAS